METEGRYTLVGTLVLAVIALMTLAIVWLAGAADTIAYRNYTVYFKKQSLDGLAVGSPVKMRGIKVGVVDGYDFASTRDEAVAVIARVDADLEVHRGAVAYIKRNLVTGIAAIEIVNGPRNRARAGSRRGRTLPGHRRGQFRYRQGGGHGVETGRQRCADHGQNEQVLSEENQRALSQSLANLNALSGQLAANKNGLKDVMKGIREASDEFRIAAASIGQATTRVEGSLSASPATPTSR